MYIVPLVIFIIITVIILKMVTQVEQYQRGILFRFGKYVKECSPGWTIMIPFLESMRKVDIRTKAVDVPSQEAITKDNVSVQINAVLYYKISDSRKAILEVENFHYAVEQLAQTTMRNAVGSVTLDELLTERNKISTEICQIIDQASDPWGIKVENVELKDISLPADMKRVLAIAAEAEREKVAVITKAQGELEASNNLAKAAKIMAETPGALHLRTLSTLSDVSGDKSNTVVFCLPIELLRAMEAITKKAE